MKKDNPYLHSRALWDDMYGGIQKKLENSYRIIFILSGLIVLAMVGFIIISGQSRVIPYVAVLHGDELISLNAHTLDTDKSLKPMLAMYFAKRFIICSRSISHDLTLNKKRQLTAYAFTQGPSTAALKYFYEHQQGKNKTKRIIITSVIRKTAKTLHIRWQEVSKLASTDEWLSSEHYVAELQYAFKAHAGNTMITHYNPFGFYITHFDWSIESQR